jgi:hydrogenase expression/formation protein HypC
MCLAIPGQILSIEEGELTVGMVSFGGIKKEVCLALVPEARVGDYVIVHVGFAISKLDEDIAHQTLAMLAGGELNQQEQGRSP